MIVIILMILGLCFGSFVNAFVYRLYENDKDTFFYTKKTQTKKHRPKLSIWNGRSICVNCKHQLSALDLIPVLSWIYLGGKCRYCKNTISWQYPAVELTTALLFLISYIFWPESFNSYQIGLFVFWCIYLIGFMALNVFDLRWYLLPNKIVFSLIGVYLLQVLYMIFSGELNFNQSLAILTGSLLISGFFWVLFHISNGAWIGGGDVKLGLLLGALAGGILQSLLLIFIASLLGSIIGGIYLIIAKRFKLKAQLPFGPYLMVSTIIVFLFGTQIIDIYKSIIL